MNKLIIIIWNSVDLAAEQFYKKIKRTIQTIEHPQNQLGKNSDITNQLAKDLPAPKNSSSCHPKTEEAPRSSKQL